MGTALATGQAAGTASALLSRLGSCEASDVREALTAHGAFLNRHELPEVNLVPIGQDLSGHKDITGHR